jgi:putative tricarboxylic transport membrane protein
VKLGGLGSALSTTCLAALLASTAAAAQAATAATPAYPTQPITLIVPFAPGGPTEALARRLAEALARELDARVIIETIGGGGGTRGAARVARARADGYTLLLHHAGHTAAPFVHRRLPYDPIKDFAPVGEIAEVPMTLIGRSDLPSGFAELKAWIRERGPTVRIGHAGPGSASYLCGLMLVAAIETKPTPVTYKGTSRALDGLQKGQVDLLCDQTLNTVAPISAKRVRAYLISGETRVPALPDVPTAKEVGADGLNALTWYGLFAPAATPPAIVARLATALQRALKEPALRESLQPLGVRVADPAAATPDGLRKRIAADGERWRTVWSVSEPMRR